MGVNKATVYTCDNRKCDNEKTVVTSGPAVLYGGCNPVADWIILADGTCYCSMKCMAKSHQSPTEGKE